MSPHRRCSRCQDAIETDPGRKHTLCEPCWFSVPLELRRAYANASRSRLGSRRTSVDPTTREISNEITAWVKANPIRREAREPLWKQNRTS